MTHVKDKILMWCDTTFVYFNLAYAIQKNYDCDLYSIIEVPDKTKKFFEQQKFVNFNKFWFLHDYLSKTKKKPNLQYLKSIEEKYHINLWLIAFNDRLFYKFNDYYKFTTDEVLSILEQECRLYENILDEIKPDFVLMSSTNQQQNQLFHDVCKGKGIKILITGSARLGQKMIISTELNKLDNFDVNFENNQKEMTNKELEEYLKLHDPRKRLTSKTGKWQNSNTDYFKAILHYIFSSNTNVSSHYSYYGRTKLNVIIKMLVYTLKKRYREFFMKNNLEYEIDESKPFIYFPLHQEQERALLIGAPFHTNQFELVRSIVKSLPVGYNLYVKDHHAMVLRGWRSVSECKEIMNLPNVHILHPSVSNENIMTKCSLVITVNGTPSLEAAFHLKPSIIFTDTGYIDLPSMYKIKTIEELPQAIRTLLQKKVELSDVNRYVSLIEKNSFNFDLAGIFMEFAETFHHSGFLVDAEIPISKMETFIKNHEKQFNTFAIEYIKKIKQYKKFISNKYS